MFDSFSGMSRDEIRDKYPEVYEARQRDKLNFRWDMICLYVLYIQIDRDRWIDRYIDRWI
jgi:broad specificity phosphatase PhoE